KHCRCSPHVRNDAARRQPRMSSNGRNSSIRDVNRDDSIISFDELKGGNPLWATPPADASRRLAIQALCQMPPRFAPPTPPSDASPTDAGLALGLRRNWYQFSLLLVVNAFVGGMVGMERAVLPLLAEREFGLASKAAILSFIVSFGVVKAVTNLA